MSKTVSPIEVVYQHISPELAQEIIQFWLIENAIPSLGEAQRRVSEVVCIARNGSQSIIGISSVYLQNYRHQNDPYYFYRMYIRKGDRTFALMSQMSKITRVYLSNYGIKETLLTKPKGMILVGENPKMQNTGFFQFLQRRGWEYEGKGPKGYPVWRYEFT